MYQIKWYLIDLTSGLADGIFRVYFCEVISMKENPMVNYSKIIADTASNHYNVRDEYKMNSISE